MSEGVEIVVLPYGHVLIGRLSQDGQDYVLNDAATIRVWGTNKEGDGGGLGLLSREGRQPSTILDPEMPNRIPCGGILRRISVAPEAAKTLGY